MNWKSVTAIALFAATVGFLVNSNPVKAQAEATASNTVESRLAAIEKYLHIDELQKNQNVVTDAKTFDELKAAMIKLDTEQDSLARKIRSAGQSSTASDDSKELDAAKREIENLRTSLRTMEERIRKLEQKTR